MPESHSFRVNRMQIVKALADANVLDEAGQDAYKLHRRRRYLLYDQEIARGVQAGALKSEAVLDDVLQPYRGEDLQEHRLILPFIGRAGDAIAAASCIAALVEAHPGITVDIACPPYAAQTLELLPAFGDILPYPLEADDLKRYDFYLGFEAVETLPDAAKRSCADLFSSCLHTPKPTAPARITIPNETAANWQVETPGPRIAVHIGERANLRTYPAERAIQLVGKLIDEGWHVFLFGAVPMGVNSKGTGADRLHNYLARTPTAADLAALLAQMDAVITGDSFPMHLAGALGVPTVAIFTATATALADDYACVTPVQSNATCSPCWAAGGACPMHHEHCIAHDDAALDPERIFEAVATAAQITTPANL